MWRLVAAVLVLLASVAVPDETERVGALLVRLGGKDAVDRAAAAKALARLGDGPAAAALTKALSDEAEPVRHSAACALAARGDRGEAVVAVLVRSLASARLALEKAGGVALVNAIQVFAGGEARLVPPLGELPKDEATLAALAEILKRDKEDLRAEIAGAGK